MVKRRKNSINYILCILILIGCQDQRQVSLEYSFENIDEEIPNVSSFENPIVVKISDLIPNKWEKVFVIKPYTTITEINDLLGFKWEEAKGTHITQDDGFNLLVFTRNKEVMSYVKWPRDKGDFINIKSNEFIVSEANFLLKMEKYGEQDWLFFYKE